MLILLQFKLNINKYNIQAFELYWFLDQSQIYSFFNSTSFMQISSVQFSNLFEHLNSLILSTAFPTEFMFVCLGLILMTLFNFNFWLFSMCTYWSGGWVETLLTWLHYICTYACCFWTNFTKVNFIPISITCLARSL